MCLTARAQCAVGQRHDHCLDHRLDLLHQLTARVQQASRSWKKQIAVPTLASLLCDQWTPNSETIKEHLRQINARATTINAEPLLVWHAGFFGWVFLSQSKKESFLSREERRSPNCLIASICIFVLHPLFAVTLCNWNQMAESMITKQDNVNACLCMSVW